MRNQRRTKRKIDNEMTKRRLIRLLNKAMDIYIVTFIVAALLALAGVFIWDIWRGSIPFMSLLDALGIFSH